MLGVTAVSNSPSSNPQTSGEGAAVGVPQSRSRSEPGTGSPGMLCRCIVCRQPRSGPGAPGPCTVRESQAQ